MTDAPSAATLAALAIRKTHYGPNTSLSYSKPLHIVRGEGCYLFDDLGQRYLDCVNNVSHCGHGDPQVRAAMRTSRCFTVQVCLGLAQRFDWSMDQGRASTHAAMQE